MNKCTECGSYAINHHCHGRDGSDPELCDVCYWRVRATDYAALEAECERLRMQLAACGVVALANTPESAAQARQMHPDYMSASCSDVADAVDREITLRQQRDKLAGLLRKVLITHKMCPDLAPSLSLCADIETVLAEVER